MKFELEDVKDFIDERINDIKSLFKSMFRFSKNVWRFRKELWNFRDFDYNFNLKIFIKSLELTANHLGNDKLSCHSAEQGPQNAKNIREFIRLMKAIEYPEDEAKRITGISFKEAYSIMSNDITKWDFSWTKNDPETWTEGQKKYIIYTEKCRQIELEYWKKGMNLLKDNMKLWWD